MKKIYLLFLIFSTAVQAQIVIADANFKTALIAAGVDTNNNGEIDSPEALAVTNLNVVGSLPIVSISGIENFTNLNELEFSGSVIMMNADFRALANLTRLIANDFQAQTFLVDGLANLTHLECKNSRIDVLDLTGVENLEYLDVSVNPELATLNLNTAPNLTTINCNSTNLSTLNVNQFPNLQHIESNYNQNIFSLDISALPQLTYLSCTDSSLMTLNIGSIANIEFLDCTNNALTVLNVNGLTRLTSLICTNNDLTVLSINALTSLTVLECAGNQLTALNITNQTQLVTLNCDFNMITALNTNVLLLLENLDCRSNRLTSLNVSSLSRLKRLHCGANWLTSLTLPLSGQLNSLMCYDNQLTALNLNNQGLLTTINFSGNQVAAVNFTATPLVTLFSCENNLFQTVDISAFPNLIRLICGNPLLTQIIGGVQNNQLQAIDIVNSLNLTTVDFSSFPILSSVAISQIGATQLDFSANPEMSFANLRQNPNLEFLNLKNGGDPFTFFEWFELPSLRYICTDDGNIANINTELGENSISNVEVNSYCSFSPGGLYNTISGKLVFDADGNGCSETDRAHPQMKIKINDVVLTGAGFTDNDGNYTFFTNAGNYTITPDFENSSWFTVTPPAATIPFPTVDHLTAQQDFCIASNGVHYDTEIVIVPQGIVRPGFDAHYKIVYKNKGNQAVSGTISIEFDDLLSDFVSANPAPASQATNMLHWNFSNLQPFEARSIDVILNLNSPTDTPPLHIDDRLVYTAEIVNTNSDEILSDNTFRLSQVVVNSFDPNDKTCLEGETIDPSHIGKYMHYNINFENTGTADAINIVVKDVVDITKFSIESLQVLDSSHPVNVKINGNVVEFIFEGINLPPSMRNPIGGHGNVLFKIKTNSDLLTGDIVKNTANIYFDYNAPIVTNEAQTAFRILSSQEFERDLSVKAEPNPVKDFIKIRSKNTIRSIGLFDVQGRILQTSIENKKETVLDLSKQASGIYFLKITTEKGNKVEKIIKK